MPLTQLAEHPVSQLIADAFAETPAVRVFVVGGAVRDALLDRPLKDLDLVVAGVPLPELESILGRLGRVDVVGKHFAVLKVAFADGASIDVALPRTDAPLGTGGYRDVTVAADPNLPIEADLARRDFTVNAMAWEIRSRTLIDPFGGQTDLAGHLIRSVGDAHARFREDATRMVRAIRIAAELFFQLEPTTRDAIRASLALLEDVAVTPREVLARELVRALVAAPVRTLDLLDETGILTILLPEIVAMKGCAQPPEYHAEGDVWQHTRLALESLTDESFAATFNVRPSAQLVVTVLLHDIGKPPTQIHPAPGSGDRIRFNEHAPVGAKVARAICDRLRLTSAGIDGGMLTWAIEHHLDLLNLETMRATTVERTFLHPPERGLLLQQLSWADARASLDPDEAAAGAEFHEPQRFRRLQERLVVITSAGFTRGRPTPLLSGNDIQRELGFPPGPKIGEAIEELREAQLAGTVSTQADAVAFLRERYAADAPR